MKVIGNILDLKKFENLRKIERKLFYTKSYIKNIRKTFSFSDVFYIYLLAERNELNIPISINNTNCIAKIIWRSLLMIYCLIVDFSKNTQALFTKIKNIFVENKNHNIAYTIPCTKNGP